MTMYSEDGSLSTTIMQGVMKNIIYLSIRDCGKTWGEGGWKNVVVHIVSDRFRKVRIANSHSCYGQKRVSGGRRDYIKLYDRRQEVCDDAYICYTTQSTSYDACSFCCLTPLHSFRHYIEQDQKLGKSNRPYSDHPLLEREEPAGRSIPTTNTRA